MSNEKDDRLLDVVKEYNYWRQKQYDYEWEDDKLNAKWARDQANYYKTLIKRGIIWEPKF